MMSNPPPPHTHTEKWHVRRQITLNFAELEDVQIEILKVLLTHSDPVEVSTSLTDSLLVL